LHQKNTKENAEVTNDFGIRITNLPDLLSASAGRHRYRCHVQRTVQLQRELSPGAQHSRAVHGQPVRRSTRCAHYSANHKTYRAARQSADQHSSRSAAAHFQLITAVVA
jgi:hypothetical protein